jgi:Flp pilus assembly pilin Flp
VNVDAEIASGRVGRTVRYGGARDARGVPSRGHGDAGASLVEYALLLALVAVVAIGALVTLGGSVSNTVDTVGSSIVGTVTSSSSPANSSGQLALSDPSGNAGPYDLTVPGAGGTAQFGTSGGTGAVSFALGTATGGSNESVPSGASISGTGLLTIPGGSTAGTYEFLVEATDSASPVPASTQLVVDLTITPPTVLVAAFAFGSGPYPCAVGSSSTSLAGNCSTYGWLDGYYVYVGGAWELVSGTPSGSRQITGEAAYSDGVGDGWTCTKTTSDGSHCVEISTHVGTFADPIKGTIGK